MKSSIYISLAISVTLILATSQTINAQIAKFGNSTLSKIIEEKFSLGHLLGNDVTPPYKGPSPSTVHVNYESPTTILISGDLINADLSLFNSNLWEAMDLLKSQYGFRLQNVMTPGVGSVGNPQTIYILMTR